MSLTKVWLQTQWDGLVRADQVIGINAHQTPELTGKPSHWLLDVVLPAPIGSGRREDWELNILHRTLVQTSHHPGDAPAVLARLLAQLDGMNAAGVIGVGHEEEVEREAATGGLEAKSSSVLFRFVPFASAQPVTPGSDTEYL